ncbi:MAG: replicative DNA helicase [Eubacterium sp.]|nr:replicative DNA helicase [Eubacterium sp.]
MAEENVIKRIPPQDLNAEKSVIGSMLLDKDAISEVSSMLTKEDFSNAQYGILFEAIVSLYNEGKPIDEIVLSEKLREMGAPDSVANLNYIGEILAGEATAAFARNYAQIVKDKSYLRKLIKLAENMMASAYEGRENADDIMEKSESEMFALMQKKSGLRDFTSINEVLSNVISEIEAATLNKGKINGLRTGFTDLDNMLTGLHGGELLLVAARPAMGKTAFVLNIAHHVAFKEKVPVVVFSLEMSAEQLVTRLVSVDSMVEAKSLKTGEITDDDWIKIVETTNNMAGADLFIDDNSSITIAELRTKCRKLHQTKNIGLIIIDYLQLMNSSSKVESRQLFIAEVSRALKGLAKELNVPVIALSQLNRAVDSRPDHRPQLADLRESGAIEQDADVVMFIYRDDYYTKEESLKPGVAEITIAKQRNGATGVVDLAWIGKFTKFANVSYATAPASSEAPHQT